MNNLSVEHMKNKLRELLDCNEKNVEVLAGVNLLSLLFVIEFLSKDQNLSPKEIHKVIYLSRYQLEDGNIVDVVTGVRLGLPKEKLLEIAIEASSFFNKTNRK